MVKCRLEIKLSYAFPRATRKRGKEDKTHHDYYVTMSGFEFQLLLGREGVLEKIESFLANDEPHVSLVERTARQMRLFVDAAKKSESSLVVLFEKAIGILEAYTKHHDLN